MPLDAQRGPCEEWTVDLAAMEQSLRGGGAGAILVEPRLLLRVIKRHRAIHGLGLSVPHGRCYALGRDALLALIDATELGTRVSELSSEVVLIARPERHDVEGAPPAALGTQLWRASFHGLVHLALEQRNARGELDGPRLRERIDRIGQTAFDEIRLVLRQDDLLLPPHDDREAFTEFAAVYLELRRFAPAMIARMFPALGEHAAIDSLLGADVDATALLARARPDGAVMADPQRAASGTAMPTFSALPSIGLGALAGKGPSARGVARLLARAEKARAQGDLVRAALLGCRAATGVASGDPPGGRARARVDLEALANRLASALRSRDGEGGEIAGSSWTALLVMLADSAEVRGNLRYPIEARLLYDLQRACVAFERTLYTVDLVTWALALGARPVVRPLPAARDVQVARHLRAATKKLRHVRLGGGASSPDRKLLSKLLRHAADRAEHNLRVTLRPAILGVLDRVNLQPKSVPERASRAKLVEELLDHVATRGFFGIGHLRDAVSRNHLKLPDLSGPGEILRGDPLLAADRELAIALDGVYRGGEIYLRWLQKVSSMAFGTRVGRAVTLYLLLPALGAFTVLEGVTHMVSPVSTAVGLGPLHLLDARSFAAMAVVLLVLLHSERARHGARVVLSAIGTVLSAVLWRFPRWILRQPAIERLLQSRVASIALRHLLLPAAAAAAVYQLSPLRDHGEAVAMGGAALVFAASSALAASRVMIAASRLVLAVLGVQWRTLTRRVLPGLFRLIVTTFKFLTDLLERIIYEVDEWLRFRDRHRPLATAARAVTGVVWFAVAYVVRLYTNLLVEPEVNPIKHFPVVTVAAKILLPFTPQLMAAIQGPLMPLGAVAANAIAAPTVFLLPGVFGFLVWELKENWRLYERTRPPVLRPALLGPHGETMDALMKPGFHSGTLPKLHARLRHAARRAAGGHGALTRLGMDPVNPARQMERGEAALRKSQEELEALELALRRFIEREIIALLVIAPRWPHGPLEVAAVDLHSNRIRIELLCPRAGGQAASIAFEEQSGWLVASVPDPGWIAALDPGAPRLLFENALAGLYARAGVDLVREQVEASLEPGAPYDISDEGLVVWPGAGYATEVLYRLRRGGRARLIPPVVRGAPPLRAPESLDPRQILFLHQSIRWLDWVAAWSPTAGVPGIPIPRLVRGGSLLPAAR